MSTRDILLSNMKSLITYDDSNRVDFDHETRSILDALLQRYSLVQIELDKHAAEKNRWFVQVSESREQLPAGVYGSSLLEAAARLAAALKVPT